MMTSRERWLAALSMKPVDRLPFWPKLDGAYPHWRKGRFAGMDLDALHGFVGSDRHVWLGRCCRDARSRWSVESAAEGNDRLTVYTSRLGAMRERQRFEPDSQSTHPVEFPIKSREDLALMRDVYEDVRVELHSEPLEKARARAKEVGEDAVTAQSVGTTALMWFIEHLAGIEVGHALLADHPDEVEALFAAMHRVNRDRVRLSVESSPADILYMIENTSTTLISPAQFRRYCAPALAEYAAMANAKGRRLVFHMCGLLKALLPDIAPLGGAGIEAFTAPTLGDTTLLDGRAACPDLCLIGGTQATFWTRPAKEIIARIDEALAPLPHHRGIVVTSAGVMPPMCEPETIREVCEWVKAYPAVF